MNIGSNNIFNILKKIKSDDLFRSGSIVFIAMVISSAFFYFNNIVLGRIMGIAAYGEFGALFSLAFFLQFILLRSVTVIDAQFVSKFKGQGNLQIIPPFHSKMQLYMTIAGLAAFGIFAILSGQIAYFLHIDSIVLVLFVGVLFLFCWPLSVNAGTMQGLQRFNQVAIMNILPQLFRFIISVTLVLIGFGLYGAVGGLAIGTVIALIVSFYLLRDVIGLPGLKNPLRTISDSDTACFSSKDISFEIKKAYRFSIPVLFAVVCIAIPTNIDVVLIKHFFTSEDTGLYTAVSVFGRMIFSIPVAIVTVMYPKVVEAHAKNSETGSLLKRSLFYTVIPTGLLVILFFILPKLFLGIFYGEEYIEAASLLQLYGVFIFFFSLITILVYNSLAKNRYLYVYLFTAFSIIELGIIWLYHSSLVVIIQIFLFISIILFIIGILINYSYSIPKYRARKNKG